MSYALEPLCCDDLGVVIDTTSANIRYGVTGADYPMGVFPKNDSAEVGAAPILPSWPVTRGKVTDWEHLEKVWSYGFMRSGFNGYDQRIPVEIVTAMPSFEGPAKDLQKMAELLFETFEVGSLRFEAQPVAGLHASGRTTGVGVSVGSGLTQVMPVFNGIPLQKHFPTCAGYMQLGMQDVDAFLLAQVPELRQLDQFQVNLIKAKQCIVPDFAERGLPEQVLAGSTFADNTAVKDVELPDGQCLALPPSAWQCGEVFFNPAVGGNLVRMDSDWHSVTSSGGVAAFVAQKAGEVPAYHVGEYQCGDWRVAMSTCLAMKYTHQGQVREAQVLRELMRNVCIFGDSTMFNGFTTRLEREMRATGPPQLDIKVAASKDRDVQQWIGGSIAMSLAAVTGATRGGYQEYGPIRVADAFSMEDNMLLQEDYELMPPDVSEFETLHMGGTGGSPVKDEFTQGSALEFNAKDFSHQEATVKAAHPSPLWTPLKFIAVPSANRLVIKVGPAMREHPSHDGGYSPLAMIDEEDGPAHVFQRAPALQLLHDRITAAGIEVSYRNEPGADMAFKLIFLDGEGIEFFHASVLSFQGIKDAYARYATLHGSRDGAPALEEMYENSKQLTLAQLSYFEAIDKDPREYIPETYFSGLEAYSCAWEAVSQKYSL